MLTILVQIVLALIILACLIAVAAMWANSKPRGERR